MAGTTTAPRARRRRGPGWVPQQHGAWAMVLAPVLVGALDSGARPVHALLLVAWVVGYLAYNATGLWLKARRRPRWWPPVRAYGAAALALTTVLLVLEPTLLRWGVVLVPAAVVSLTASARRADRSWTNDLVAVGAAGLLGVVAHGLGTDGTDGTTGAWLPGAGSARAWLLAGVLTAYFVGTVPYVKTMIRDRGDPTTYRISVVLHGVLLAAAGAGVAWAAVEHRASVPAAVGLVVLAAALLARAAVVPRRWPQTTPKQLGIGEIVATVLLCALLLALP